jgi:predicted histidine transporter YuiF (NhaC family)
MNPFHDFIILMLVIGLLLALAIAFLLLRDRRTLQSEMSEAECRRAAARNLAQTFHWWHIAGLAAIINTLLLDRDRVPHQRAWVSVFDAAIMAFLIFRYYRKRSNERSEETSFSNSPPPIH